MADRAPLRCTAAGQPKNCWQGHTGPYVVLSGHSESHYGVRVMTPCTLVEDPTSPLRLSVIGEGSLRSLATQDQREHQRWVVLLPPDGDIEARRRAIAPYGALWSKNVRLVYSEEVAGG